MADYYTVLKRAVTALPENSGELRRDVYEKARKAIIRQLEGFEPPLSPSEITRQRLALEECIRRVEAEAAREALGLGTATAAPPSPLEPAPSPAETSASEDEVSEETEAQAPESDKAAADAAADKPAESEEVPVDADSEPPPAESSESEPSDDGDGEQSVFQQAIAEAEALGNTAAQAGRSARAAIAGSDDDDTEPEEIRHEPVLAGDAGSLSAADDDKPEARVEPVIAGADDGDKQGDDIEAAAEDALDPLPGGDTVDDGAPSRMPMIAAAVGLVLLVVAVGALIYSQRDLLSAITSDEDGAATTTSSGSTTSSAEDSTDLSPKSTDRLPGSPEDLKAEGVRKVTTTVIMPPSDDGGDGQATPSPPEVRNVTPGVGAEAPTDEPAPAQSTDTEPATPATPESEPAASTPPASEVAAAPSDSAAQPEASASSSSAVVAQGAILYEEGATPSATGAAFKGTVAWDVVDENSQNGPVLRATIDIPDRSMKVVLSIRRNTDTKLPASHMVEILFNLPENFAGKGIGNVPGLIMKITEEAPGEALVGASVRVAKGLFWIALSSTATEQERNEQLLKDRAWIDIPLLYDNDKRAILTLEKGNPGEQSIDKVFTAWSGG